VLSLLFLPFAFYFIYEIARQGWGERAAKGTILTLAFFQQRSSSMRLTRKVCFLLYLRAHCGLQE
jgi:hypothetical protein